MTIEAPARDSMGRQGGDATVVGSSIVLLQERFKRLQRMREKREERELLKLFSDSEPGTPTKRCQPAATTVSYQPGQIFPSRPPHEDSLSLGLNLYSNHADVGAMKAPAFTSSWSADAAIVSTSSRAFDNSDVDTSLHL